jgi:hypothetical protein
MSESEDTLPSLWDGTRVCVHSDKLSVQHSCCDAIAEFRQGGEEAVKIVGLIDFFK